MNVLLVHNYYQSALIGGEDLVFEKELSALQGKVNLATFTVSNDNIKYPSLFWQMFGFGENAKKLKKAIYEHRADVVHFHNTFPLLSPRAFSVAKRAGAKVIVTMHNYRPWCINGTFFKDGEICTKCSDNRVWPAIKNKCYKNSLVMSVATSLIKKQRVWQKSFDYVDKFIALTEHQLNMLKKLGIPEHKIVIKPHASSSNKLSASRSGLLFVGRLEEGKGYLDALELMKVYPKYTLTVIGDGPLASYLRPANVKWLGSVEPSVVAQHYAQAKYLLNPAKHFETFGLTILEAMSAGTPVIGYPIGTRVDFIQDGKTGWFLPLDLDKVMNYPGWNAMSSYCRSFAANFDEQRLTSQQLEIYESLL